MLEPIILGIIQGIVEWLPISSEGFLILAKINIFDHTEDIGTLLKELLFLHFGTFLAALIYFRKDVLRLIKALFRYKSQDIETKNILVFLIITTLISGIIGIIFLYTLTNLEDQLVLTGKGITLFIGALLLITAYLQLKPKNKGYRDAKDIKNTDSILLGIMQGLAVLPGMSRSGLTVSTLLLRKFDEIYALKLSFLMSLPIVLGGNIILNYNNFNLTLYNLLGLLFAFVFGILTIDLLLKLARKINFGYFVLIFGVLTIISVLI